MDDANRNVPGDNISVSTFTFTGAQLGGLQPTLGGVFDGHGGEKVAQNCVRYIKDHYREVGREDGLDGSVVGGGAAAPDELFDEAKMMAEIARQERHGSAPNPFMDGGGAAAPTPAGSPAIITDIDQKIRDALTWGFRSNKAIEAIVLDGHECPIQFKLIGPEGASRYVLEIARPTNLITAQSGPILDNIKTSIERNANILIPGRAAVKSDSNIRIEIQDLQPEFLQSLEMYQYKRVFLDEGNDFNALYEQAANTIKRLCTVLSQDDPSKPKKNSGTTVEELNQYRDPNPLHDFLQSKGFDCEIHRAFDERTPRVMADRYVKLFLTNERGFPTEPFVVYIDPKDHEFAIGCNDYAYTESLITKNILRQISRGIVGEFDETLIEATKPLQKAAFHRWNNSSEEVIAADERQYEGVTREGMIYFTSGVINLVGDNYRAIEVGAPAAEPLPGAAAPDGGDDLELAAALAASLAQGAAPPDGGDLISPEDAARMKINDAIARIETLMTTEKTAPDYAVLNSVEAELQESARGLDEAVKNFFNANPEGIISLNLESFTRREVVILEGDKVSVAIGRGEFWPLEWELRGILNSTYVAEYKNTDEYTRQLEDKKYEALESFVKDQELLLPNPEDGENLYVNRPLSFDNIAQSRQVIHDMNYEVQEHIAAFRLGVEENYHNPQPTTPYRGIGVKAVVVDLDGKKKGLQISEIFSANNQRFKVQTDDMVDENPDKDDVLKYMQDALIISVSIDGEERQISDLLALGEEGMKQIAAAFHSDGEVEFKTIKQNEEEQWVESIVTCDNSKNKTAVYCPTNPDEITPPGEEKPTFTALRDGLDLEEGNAFYYEVCDQVVERGMLFANYWYHQEEVEKALLIEAQKYEVVFLPGNISCVFDQKNEEIDERVLVVYQGFDIVNVGTLKASMEIVFQDEGNDLTKRPLRIVYPGNFGGGHWATGEIIIDERNNARSIIHDPLNPNAGLSPESLQVIANVLKSKGLINDEANIKQQRSPYPKRQYDATNCGPIAAREVMLIAKGYGLAQEYPAYDPSLKIQDFKHKVFDSQAVENFHNRVPEYRDDAAGVSDESENAYNALMTDQGDIIDRIRENMDKFERFEDEVDMKEFCKVIKELFPVEEAQSGGLATAIYVNPKAAKDPDDLKPGFPNAIISIVRQLKEVQLRSGAPHRSPSPSFTSPLAGDKENIQWV